MANSTRNPLLQFLRRTVVPCHAAHESDAQLLRRFVDDHDSGAFAALVRRYGPLVLGVCQRVLDDPHDVEDGFQATFLVLVRKAGAVNRPHLLANWLYGVAYRAAVKIRAGAARRRAMERRAVRMTIQQPVDDLLWRDLRPVLDKEIERLSDKYRVPFVLCCLESKTSAEAALLLACPEGTIVSRLGRARELLRTRLARRGITLTSALLAALLTEKAAPAALPSVLVQEAVKVGMLLVAGQGSGVASAAAVSAADHVASAMTVSKLRFAATLALLFVATGLTTGVLVRQKAAPEQSSNTATSAAETPKDGLRAAQNAVTAALERSYKSYVELQRTFWGPDEVIPVKAVVSPVPLEDKGITQRKGNWDKMAAATRKDRRYQILVKVFKDGTKEVWRSSQPLDPEPLARLSRSLVSDGKTVHTLFDPDSTIGLQIPAGSFPAGTYRVHLFFLDLDGVEHAFRNAGTLETARQLVVRSSRLNLKDLLLPSRSVDDRALLTKATEIANPGRRQFPKDDPGDCQARSIWCLERFQGRVYVGYGDWDQNRGPIDVWSFGPESAQLKARYPSRYSFTAGTSPRLLFTKEYTVQEESIDRFRVLGDRLVIPGIDGNKENGPDGIVFSNLYIRERGLWRKLSTLPRGPHIMDVMELDKCLIALVNGLQMSDDGGLTWKEPVPGQGTQGAEEFVKLRDGLLIFGDGEGGAFYRKGKLETHLYDFFPSYDDGRAHRSKAFLDGVVYTAFHNWGMKKEVDRPLFYFRDFGKPPQIVELFRGKFVRDTLLEDGRLYVLTGLAGEKDFVGEIFATTNLRDWTRLAVFTTPAMPSAFCRLEGRFYVGLANRGYDPLTYDEHKARRYAYADKLSGSIWLLGR